MITDSHDNILISTSLSLLKQHKKIHHYSFLVTVSLFVLLIALSIIQQITLLWSLVLIVVIILDLFKMYYDIRLGFDLSLLKNFTDRYIYAYCN